MKLLLWVVLVALIYHTLAGIRHIIMDFGLGESMEGGVRSSHLVIALSVILALVAGVWLW
ncbi:MAG: succinate dehydrogenase, cytochrome b556 subunit [Halioglobus sp.]|nr:succinate dehydrogenase, cytochrome b556 subunit [Halioglobus sp.]